MNDFSDDPETYLKNQQEANLLYVATTRAMNTCYYNSVVEEISKSVAPYCDCESRADMANYMLELQLEQSMI